MYFTYAECIYCFIFIFFIYSCASRIRADIGSYNNTDIRVRNKFERILTLLILMTSKIRIHIINTIEKKQSRNKALFTLSRTI